MLRGTFADLHAAGCMQTGADVEQNEVKARLKFGDLLRGLMLASGGDPCNGCPQYKGGSCKAFKQFNDRAPRAKAPTFVRPATRCSKCGLKIRRPGHADGDAHRMRSK